MWKVTLQRNVDKIAYRLRARLVPKLGRWRVATVEVKRDSWTMHGKNMVIAPFVYLHIIITVFNVSYIGA